MFFSATPKFVPDIPNGFRGRQSSSPIRAEFLERIYPMLKQNPAVWVMVLESSPDYEKFRSNLNKRFMNKYGLQSCCRSTATNDQGQKVGELYFRYIGN